MQKPTLKDLQIISITNVEDNNNESIPPYNIVKVDDFSFLIMIPALGATQDNVVVTSEKWDEYLRLNVKYTPKVSSIFEIDPKKVDKDVIEEIEHNLDSFFDINIDIDPNHPERRVYEAEASCQGGIITLKLTYRPIAVCKDKVTKTLLGAKKDVPETKVATATLTDEQVNELIDRLWGNKKDSDDIFAQLWSHSPTYNSKKNGWWF